MVYSKLNKDINYIENKETEKDDIGYETQLYIIPYGNINDNKTIQSVNGVKKEIAVVLGKPNYRYSASKDIIFYPIYLLKNYKIKGQIGVYELLSQKALHVLDKEGDIIIRLLGEPLFFGFVNDEFLENEADNDPTEIYENTPITNTPMGNVLLPPKQLPPVLEEDAETVEDDDDEMDVMKLNIPAHSVSVSHKEAEKTIEEGIFMKDTRLQPSALLEEENESISASIKKEYKPANYHNWIQKFTKNDNYGIIDNEKGGDCFFAVIRDAFSQLGMKTTVAKLRALLATELTNDVFQENRNLYLSFQTQKNEIIMETKKINKILLTYKKRTENATDEKTSKIQNETELFKDELARYEKELKEIKRLENEYIVFMKDIDTLEKYREYIQTSNYWADTWAISTLEVLLNMKMIILSQEAYKQNSYDNVLNCGEISNLIKPNIPENGNDEIRNMGNDGVERSAFHPKYYIMTSYTGDHYTLVSYKKKRILQFSEIPYDIKIMIVNKCLERSAGAYYIIPEFRDFKSHLGIQNDDDTDENEDENKEDEYNDPEKYGCKTTFVYHTNSMDAKIGKGAGEQIQKNRIQEYMVLNTMTNWRRKIDDMWVSPFVVGGLKWSSVENYVQGSKFKKGFPDYYELFSLNSNSDISKEPKKAREAATQKSKRPTNVKPDVDFDLGRDIIERETAVRAKFKQNPELKQILLATRGACIKHFIRGNPPETDTILMKIRDELQK